ncbi:hypothetical protein M8818_006453 [Zalaria obscura]|uniref:Uncharacterized protein n=1 Tax=Zalaria obscura TaxID=2024903 RepID=A0ACC3S7P2_9PEZI
MTCLEIAVFCYARVFEDNARPVWISCLVIASQVRSKIVASRHRDGGMWLTFQLRRCISCSCAMASTGCKKFKRKAKRSQSASASVRDLETWDLYALRKDALIMAGDPQLVATGHAKIAQTGNPQTSHRRSHCMLNFIS